MLTQTLKIVSYLVVSLLVGVGVTLLTDKIENRAVEQRIRKTVESDIRSALSSFRESAARRTPSDEQRFLRKFAGTVLSDKVSIHVPGEDNLLKHNPALFLFTLKADDYTFDFYVRNSYLRSELAILDAPDYLTGITATIVLFSFIVFYTENRKRVRAMETALQQHEALALLGRMTAALAHELKTPVATISNLVQTFPARRSDEQFVKRFIELTREELNRTEQLIDHLLAYGKEIVIGNAEWMPAGPLLRKAAPNGIAVDVPQQFEVYGDHFYLDLLFKNIVRNSREAGAGTVQVRVHLPPGAEHGEIICDDNGSGFPLSADIEHLADPFVTSRSRGGGLGLYLAGKIATAHGGSLSLARIENGARVIIALPLSRIKVEGS